MKRVVATAADPVPQHSVTRVCHGTAAPIPAGYSTGVGTACAGGVSHRTEQPSAPKRPLRENPRLWVSSQLSYGTGLPALYLWPEGTGHPELPHRNSTSNL